MAMTLEELQRRADALIRMGQVIAAEKDANKIVEMSNQMQVMAQELEAAAQQFERDYPQKGAPGMVRVQLTTEQRQRVFERTGVRVDVVHMPDPGGTVTATMPRARPEDIEIYAYQEARRLKAEEESKAQFDQQVAKLRREFAQYPSMFDKLDAGLRDAEMKAEAARKKK